MPSKEIVLSLTVVDQALRAFEKKYGFSTVEFLRNREMRNKISEDDVFAWEAFVDHRKELQDANQEVHRAYLNQLAAAPNEAPESPRPDKLALAA